MWDSNSRPSQYDSNSVPFNTLLCHHFNACVLQIVSNNFVFIEPIHRCAAKY